MVTKVPLRVYTPLCGKFGLNRLNTELELGLKSYPVNMSAGLRNDKQRKKYGLLLKAQLPRVIRTGKDNDHWISVLQSLDRKESLSSEEEEFADLLTVLVEDFEQRRYALAPASPTDVLEELFQANNLKQRDLKDIFKTESIASEVLSGKRKLTTEHIEKLIKRFNISADVFFATSPRDGVARSA